MPFYLPLKVAMNPNTCQDWMELTELNGCFLSRFSSAEYQDLTTIYMKRGSRLSKNYHQGTLQKAK